MDNAGSHPKIPKLGRRPYSALVTLIATLAILAVTLTVSPAISAAAPTGTAETVSTFGWPLQPRPHVVTRFDPPDKDWFPGHRGVDLAGTEHENVLAAADGIVVFAGPVGGRPVISIDHPGGLRTTYEPVVASVTAGSRVQRGDAIGTLDAGHAGCAAACLHWGLKRGDVYLDPLGAVHTAPIRLLPRTG